MLKIVKTPLDPSKSSICSNRKYWYSKELRQYPDNWNHTESPIHVHICTPPVWGVWCTRRTRCAYVHTPQIGGCVCVCAHHTPRLEGVCAYVHTTPHPTCQSIQSILIIISMMMIVMIMMSVSIVRFGVVESVVSVIPLGLIEPVLPVVPVMQPSAVPSHFVVKI